MAGRRKKIVATDREAISVGVFLVPAYAMTFDHPALSGHTAVGLTPEKALISARGLLASKFPEGRYDVEVIELTPERFAKANIHFIED